MRHCGEIGRHEGLKIPFWRQSAGSSPAGGIAEAHDYTLIRAIVGFFLLMIASDVKNILAKPKGISYEKRRNLFL